MPPYAAKDPGTLPGRDRLPGSSYRQRSIIRIIPF
jgi:hypothetical protein